MKIALVFPNNLFKAPYLNYYLKILNEQNIDYTIYNWDRVWETETNCISYRSKEKSSGKWNRLLEFLRYRKFITSHVTNERYDKVLIFSCQISILLSSFLLKRFKNNYLVDIRDYSKVIPFFRRTFHKVLQKAELICISSHGFESWLPNNLNYVMSHNVNKQLLENNITERNFFKTNTINVDTIGALRDHTSNAKVIDALKNNTQFYMKFIGDGYALPLLQEKAKNENISNIDFHGFYQKEEEFDLLKNTDFINIMVGNDFLSQGLTSNRLYLCALYQIPAIVNAQTEQSRIIEKFDFGIVIDNFFELEKRLIDYKNNFDQRKFVSNCNQFLDQVKKDQNIFELRVNDFVKST